MRMMEQTGCDFVMIARGALGNPWIFREAVALWKGQDVPPHPEIDEKIDLILKHFDLLLEEKGEYAAVREMRKHAGWYLKGIHGSAGIRRQLNTITKADDLKEAVASLKAR